MAQTIPNLLARLSDHLEPGPEKAYLASMIDPFSEESMGVRVPSITPEATFSSYDYDTVNFTATASGNAMFVMNYDANSVPSYLLLNHANLTNMFAASPVSLSIVD